MEIIFTVNAEELNVVLNRLETLETEGVISESRIEVRGFSDFGCNPEEVKEITCYYKVGENLVNADNTVLQIITNANKFHILDEHVKEGYWEQYSFAEVLSLCEVYGSIIEVVEGDCVLLS